MNYEPNTNELNQLPFPRHRPHIFRNDGHKILHRVKAKVIFYVFIFNKSRQRRRFLYHVPKKFFHFVQFIQRHLFRQTFYVQASAPPGNIYIMVAHTQPQAVNGIALSQFQKLQRNIYPFPHTSNITVHKR